MEALPPGCAVGPMVTVALIDRPIGTSNIDGSFGSDPRAGATEAPIESRLRNGERSFLLLRLIRCGP